MSDAQFPFQPGIPAVTPDPAPALDARLDAMVRHGTEYGLVRASELAAALLELAALRRVAALYDDLAGRVRVVQTSDMVVAREVSVRARLAGSEAAAQLEGHVNRNLARSVADAVAPLIKRTRTEDPETQQTVYRGQLLIIEPKG